MAQNNADIPKGYISIPRFTQSKAKRAKLYRLVREHRLKEGDDYKVIKKEVELILVRKDLSL